MFSLFRPKGLFKAKLRRLTLSKEDRGSRNFSDDTLKTCDSRSDCDLESKLLTIVMFRFNCEIKSFEQPIYKNTFFNESKGERTQKHALHDELKLFLFRTWLEYQRQWQANPKYFLRKIEGLLPTFWSKTETDAMHQRKTRTKKLILILGYTNFQTDALAQICLFGQLFPPIEKFLRNYIFCAEYAF